MLDFLLEKSVIHCFSVSTQDHKNSILHHSNMGYGCKKKKNLCPTYPKITTFSIKLDSYTKTIFDMMSASIL